jgi:hypothetical protein
MILPPYSGFSKEACIDIAARNHHPYALCIARQFARQHSRSSGGASQADSFPQS